ncbi:MAG: hypothetical protein MK095_09585 [Phycisphaerales bacterium]|nr:hypothetical protein [Phycisphaerales bacterium]
MALFNRKKDGKGEDDSANTPAEFVLEPVKARKWFDHAKNMADSSNYTSALVYYANGMKFDPTSLPAHEAMIRVALLHQQNGGKKAAAKDVKGVDGPHPVEKLAAAELAWLSNYASPALAVKTVSAAVNAEQLDLAKMLTPLVLKLIMKAKKVDRKQLIQMKDLAAQAGAWNEAIFAGQRALELDPSDAALDVELKDLTAQRAMSQGGYEKAAGKEGGFREFVKDMDKQRELEQEESIAGVGGSSDKVFDRAKAAYEETPEVPDVLNRYGQLLRKMGTSESLNEAKTIYAKGYKDTGEYRFRMNAGDIAIMLAKSKAESLQGDDRAKAEAETLELERTEYMERVEQYPTDRLLKYRLGEVSLRCGDIETAMGCFQKSKDEPKLRTRSGHLLGRCFAQEGWHTEAVDEYRDTINNIDPTEGELELEIRYDLMESLIELAKREQSGEHAREALDICSGIARKDITYRDIRSRRKELDELSRELS